MLYFEYCVNYVGKGGIVLQKKQLQLSTCFLLGLIGICFGSIRGFAMLFYWGPAHFLHVAFFALVGAMLLFLAVLEQGDFAPKRRFYLLCLFIALLFAFLNLPLLSAPFEAILFPLLMRLYPHGKHTKHWIFLLFIEFIFAVLQTLALTHYLGTQTLVVMGGSLLALNFFRFIFFYPIYSYSKLSSFK